MSKLLPAHLSHQRVGAGRHGPGRSAGGLQLRGVVIASYKPGDPRNASRRTPTKLLVPTITCDVLLYDPDYVTILRDVPIMRQSAGLIDSEVWVPRAATVNLLGGALTVAGNGPLDPTALYPTSPSDMDGDHVVVAFLNNDLAQPIIVGQIDHPRNTANPVFNVPPDAQYARKLRGWLFAMLADGNVVVDGVLAGAGAVPPAIPAVETPSPTAGSLRVTLKAGQKVSISLAAAPSLTQERVVTEGFLAALKTKLQAERASHQAANAAWAALNAVTPNAAYTAAATAATTAATACTTLIGLIDTSDGASDPFLSALLEVD